MRPLAGLFGREKAPVVSKHLRGRETALERLVAPDLRIVSESRETPFREAVWCAVGDSLAFALPQNALLQERYPNRNTHDAGLTHLLTRRFAVGSEIPGGSTPVDAGRLKTVSGGDSILNTCTREESCQNPRATLILRYRLLQNRNFPLYL